MSTPLSLDQLAYLRYVKGAPRSPTMTARGNTEKALLWAILASVIANGRGPLPSRKDDA